MHVKYVLPLKLITVAFMVGEIRPVCACRPAAWLHTALFLKEINAFFIGGKEDRRAQNNAVIGDAALPWNRPHWLQDRPTPSGLLLSEYTWDSICKEVFY